MILVVIESIYKNKLISVDFQLINLKVATAIKDQN